MFTLKFTKLSKDEIESIRSLFANAVEAIDQGKVRDVGDVGHIVHQLRKLISQGGRDHLEQEKRDDQFTDSLLAGVDADSVRRLQAILDR